MSGWMPYFIAVLLVLGGMLPVWAMVHAKELRPHLMLAERYEGSDALEQFGVSEKYDGVRAFWDGVNLMTRSGRVISAPAWFLAQLPDEPLDGELWLGYGRFSDVSGLIRRHDSDSHPLWQEVIYQVFDMPEHEGLFAERYKAMVELLGANAASDVRPVQQYRLHGQQELDDLLEKTLSAGGEGLMLHRWDSHYIAGRSHHLQKVTLRDDAEAIVVGYQPGKGRLAGMMGALKVRLDDGRIFEIGTGFTDAERASPPQIGTRVRYTYRGLTREGFPRFASFDRIRPPE